MSSLPPRPMRVRRAQPGELRDALFLLGLVVTFGLELLFGVQVINHPHHADPVRSIAVIVIVCFLIGIARSWELIGGPSIGLRTELTAIVRAHARAGEDAPTDAS
jgi:hypothetical protein